MNITQHLLSEAKRREAEVQEMMIFILNKVMSEEGVDRDTFAHYLKMLSRKSHGLGHVRGEIFSNQLIQDLKNKLQTYEN